MISRNELSITLSTLWCYVGGAWVNSLSYADDMVLLAHTVTAIQTLWKCVAHMLDLMTLYTTQRKQYMYADLTKASTGSVLKKSLARK